MLLITDGFPRGLGYVEINYSHAGAPPPPGRPMHYEDDTYTCSHCQYVVFKNKDRTRERYKCKTCNHHICDKCAAIHIAAGSPRCVTWNQHLEEVAEAYARQRLLPSIILP